MWRFAESQRAVHYRGQVVIDWVRLDRYKKLAAAALDDVLRCTRRPGILVAPLLQEIYAITVTWASGKQFLRITWPKKNLA
jgi:hypothetical protein